MAASRHRIMNAALRGCSWWPIVLVAAGCGILGGDDWYLDRAAILYGVDDTLALQSPATFTAGVAASVTFRTEGWRDCTRPGPTDVSVSDMLVTLAPYDSGLLGNHICPDVPCDCRHTVSITFPSAGRGTLRVIGRRVTPPAIVTVDREVDVR
jgi:hypothetical protein